MNHNHKSPIPIVKTGSISTQTPPSTLSSTLKTSTASTSTNHSQAAGLCYTVLSTIGEGTFGRVAKIKRNSDGEILVWKELSYGGMSEKEKEQLVAEVNILRELDHKFIVRYEDRIIDRKKKKIYIVMEYCSGGDLASIIKEKQKQGKYFEEDFIWKVLSQTASALEECHRKSFLHRDLKPGNLFLDEKQQIKLGDFGLARILSSSHSLARTHAGTPYYMSPEQIRYSHSTPKSDIWSLGCLLYELATLTPPFTAHNALALALKIEKGEYSAELIKKEYSPLLVETIKSLLCVDVKKRWDVKQVLACEGVRRWHEKEKRNQFLEEKIRKKERELELKKKDLDEMEVLLKEREEKLERREKEILLKEAEFNFWRDQLNRRRTLPQSPSSSPSISYSPSSNHSVSPPSPTPSTLLLSPLPSQSPSSSPTHFDSPSSNPHAITLSYSHQINNSIAQSDFPLYSHPTSYQYPTNLSNDPPNSSHLISTPHSRPKHTVNLSTPHTPSFPLPSSNFSQQNVLTSVSNNSFQTKKLNHLHQISPVPLSFPLVGGRGQLKMPSSGNNSLVQLNGKDKELIGVGKENFPRGMR